MAEEVTIADEALGHVQNIMKDVDIIKEMLKKSSNLRTAYYKVDSDTQGIYDALKPNSLASAYDLERLMGGIPWLQDNQKKEIRECHTAEVTRENLYGKVQKSLLLYQNDLSKSDMEAIVNALKPENKVDFTDLQKIMDCVSGLPENAKENIRLCHAAEANAQTLQEKVRKSMQQQSQMEVQKLDRSKFWVKFHAAAESTFQLIVAYQELREIGNLGREQEESLSDCADFVTDMKRKMLALQPALKVGEENNLEQHLQCIENIENSVFLVRREISRILAALGPLKQQLRVKIRGGISAGLKNGAQCMESVSETAALWKQKGEADRAWGIFASVIFGIFTALNVIGCCDAAAKLASIEVRLKKVKEIQNDMGEVCAKIEKIRGGNGNM